MALYKSENVSISASADRVFDKLSNLEGLGELIKKVPEDKVPADQRAMLEQVVVTPQTITFPGGPVGDVTLRLAETVRPTLIKMEGEGTPVPMSLMLHVSPISDELCEARVEIDINIPMMLKPMVNGPLQKLVDQFAVMLGRLPM
ncbi:MAG: SRPBCC family protein [Muribaculaceae bacterium]|nr:SRPBCC family protein [Muribaculaceae bacterium]